MIKCLSLLLPIVCLLAPSNVCAQQPKIMQSGVPFHGIRDYREVMPGVLYRGGANNGHAPLKQDQLDALCEAGIGTADYLYRTGSQVPLPFIARRGRSNTSTKDGKGQDALPYISRFTTQSKTKASLFSFIAGMESMPRVQLRQPH
jgi:hypothetical protein